MSDKDRSPIEKYDAEMRKAINQSWHEVNRTVDQQALKRGKIVAQFTLKSDGKIGGVTILENNAGPAEALLVERALAKQSNYKPWPPEMVRMVGTNYRAITFTFDYR